MDKLTRKLAVLHGTLSFFYFIIFHAIFAPHNKINNLKKYIAKFVKKTDDF